MLRDGRTVVTANAVEQVAVPARVVEERLADDLHLELLAGLGRVPFPALGEAGAFLHPCVLVGGEAHWPPPCPMCQWWQQVQR